MAARFFKAAAVDQAGRPALAVRVCGNGLFAAAEFFSGFAFFRLCFFFF